MPALPTEIRTMSKQKDDEQAASGPLYKGEDHSAPYPISRLSPAFDLVELAREIAEADERVTARANAQLQVIADQMKALQEEARKVLQQAQQDQQLNHARCAFTRVPGRIYHLYRRSDGTLEFSMLSPDDWGGSPPNDHIDSYLLGVDMRWTPLDQLAEREDSRETVAALLHGLTPPR